MRKYYTKKIKLLAQSLNSLIIRVTRKDIKQRLQITCEFPFTKARYAVTKLSLCNNFNIINTMLKI